MKKPHAALVSILKKNRSEQKKLLMENENFLKKLQGDIVDASKNISEFNEIAKKLGTDINKYIMSYSGLEKPSIPKDKEEAFCIFLDKTLQQMFEEQSSNQKITLENISYFEEKINDEINRQVYSLTGLNNTTEIDFKNSAQLKVKIHTTSLEQSICFKVIELLDNFKTSTQELIQKTESRINEINRKIAELTKQLDAAPKIAEVSQQMLLKKQPPAKKMQSTITDDAPYKIREYNTTKKL